MASRRWGLALVFLLESVPGSVRAERRAEARAATESRPAAEFAADSLSRLGTLLQPVVADPSSVTDASLGDQDLGRVAAIVERADPMADPPLKTTHSAAEVVNAVNATFKDFSPARLKDTPDADLSAAAGLVFDQLGGPKRPAREVLDGIAILSRVKQDRILELRRQPVQETLINPGHPENHPDIINVHGVPAEVKPFRYDGVFRHYTTREGLRSILRSRTLWNGPLSYVDLAPGVRRKVFKDLSGLFLTLPGVAGRDVGVPKDEYPFYVDLRLPKQLPLLEIEPGAIFLVPLPARTRDWVLELYRRWLDGGAVGPGELSMVEALRREGGPGPNLQVPVKIIAHGTNR